MLTLKRQLELETIFLLMIGAAISIFFVVYKNNYQPQFSMASNTPMSSPTPEATTNPKITFFSQISPDGTKKVIMKKTETQDNMVTYSFSTVNENDSNEKLIFTEKVDSSSSMDIPFNTWSPDDKYFFIEKNVGGIKSAFAFKATGEQFSGTEAYLDVTDIFAKQNTGNNFSEATGWASETLIIINTVKADNTKGLSYWFEVPGKAIIPLSTEF